MRTALLVYDILGTEGGRFTELTIEIPIQVSDQIKNSNYCLICLFCLTFPLVNSNNCQVFKLFKILLKMVAIFSVLDTKS